MRTENFRILKQRLQDIGDRFAIKSTSADETKDTLAHVSPLHRKTPQEDPGRCDLKTNSGELDRLLAENMSEQLICVVYLETLIDGQV